MSLKSSFVKLGLKHAAAISVTALMSLVVGAIEQNNFAKATQYMNYLPIFFIIYLILIALDNGTAIYNGLVNLLTLIWERKNIDNGSKITEPTRHDNTQ